MYLIIPFLWMISVSIGHPLSNAQVSVHVPNTAASVAVQKTDFLDNFNKQLQIPRTYPDFKQYGRQEAVLEQEHWLSKKDSVYDKTQVAAARYLGIKPLVDTIQESEKYGNTGENHRKFGRVLLNGFNSLGNVINTIVDLPFETKNHFGRTINAALDAVGAKLVGI